MRVKQLLLLFLFLIVVLPVLLLSFGLFTLGQSLPQESGSRSVRGAQDTVIIKTGERGIACVHAESDPDLYFGMGYVHARDRFAQMELWRRAATGQLASAIGPEGLPSDRLIGILGFAREAQRQLNQLDESTVSLLHAYTDGINAWIGEARDFAPPEFYLLSTQMTFWSPKDCLALFQWMVWHLGPGWKPDVIRARLAGSKTNRLRAEFCSFDTDLMARSVPKTLITGEPEHPFLAFSLGGLYTPLGAQGWVVGGQTTGTGHPMLGVDWYLPAMQPSWFHWICLKSKQIRTTGAMLPGIPGMWMGQNDSFAWACVPMGLDDIDLIVEQPASDDSDHYRVRGDIRPFTLGEQWIEVKHQRPVHLLTRSSHRGPVFRSPGEDGQPVYVSVRWSGFEAGTEFRAFYDLMTASAPSGFRQALSHLAVPISYWLYADRDNRYGYQVAGRVPLRSVSGAVPIDGRRVSEVWTGWKSFSSLPHRLHDSSRSGGVLVSDIHASLCDPIRLPDRIPDPIQLDRFEDLLTDLSGAGSFLADSVMRDVLSPFASDFMSLTRSERLSHRPDSWLEEQSLALLDEWDMRITPSLAAALYTAWHSELLRALYEDEFTPDLFSILKTAARTDLDRIMLHSPRRWADNINTDQGETFSDVVSMSFSAALDSLTRRYGKNPGLWKEEVGGAFNQSHPLAVTPALERLLSRTIDRYSGDRYTLQRRYHRQNMTFAPTVRMRVDFSKNPPAVGGILSSGQSGHPLAEAYDDQLEAWQQGKWFQPAIPDSQLAGETEKTLILYPVSRDAGAH